MIRIFVLLLIFGDALGQQAELLVFQNKVQDFGNIQERAGTVQHTFTFVNNSGRTARILGVQASCGCTTSGWTDQPVAPGKTGFIKAQFDPAGRPGYFSKTLSVNTDLTATPIVLTLKGNVVSGQVPADQFNYTKGALRFRNASFNMGTVYINQAAVTKEFEVLNAGPGAIQFLSYEAPPHVVVALPKGLGENERGVIQIQYDAKKKNEFGFASDKISIVTDQEAEPRLGFSLYATVEEFFPILSGEELQRAPRLKIEPAEVNAGSLRLRETKQLSVRLKNVGKRDLTIRAVQPNCSCIIAQADEKVLKPNAEATLSIQLIAEGRLGTQNKAITVYTTDPAQPVQRIPLTVVVQD